LFKERPTVNYSTNRIQKCIFGRRSSRNLETLQTSNPMSRYNPKLSQIPVYVASLGREPTDVDSSGRLKTVVHVVIEQLPKCLRPSTTHHWDDVMYGGVIGLILFSVRVGVEKVLPKTPLITIISQRVPSHLVQWRLSIHKSDEGISLSCLSFQSRLRGSSSKRGCGPWHPAFRLRVICRVLKIINIAFLF
jgi:hypothetical protein